VGEFEGRHVEVVGGHEPEVWLERSADGFGLEEGIDFTGSYIQQSLLYRADQSFEVLGRSSPEY
jgi:hypothetical protein